ncbi:binary toxin-like calcium binding domain-containing protein, partial [Enterococcus faecium]|nr:hypothetical protein [Enterococcus faecium]
FTHIFINGELIDDKGIFLNKGEIYKFIVAYFGNSNATQNDLIDLKVIPLNNGIKSEFNSEDFSIPKVISFEEVYELFEDNTITEELKDSDNDGIYDEWEKNGYTVIGNVVREWNESFASKGFKKYISNPYESHTAGDPYSDLEKASGAIDKSINKVAWDPLVAAYPSISVGMENLIISNVIEADSEVKKSVSRSTSSSIGMSNTIGIDANASFSLFSGISASTTGHYSNTSTQIVDSSKTAGQEWAKQLSIDTSKLANINANIRYYNLGTAPIYNLKTTTNLVIGKETIATILSQPNQEAFSLAPGDIYPKKNIHGISLNTLDQFSTTPITINLEQLERLELGEILKLETTQFNGAFATRNPSGGQVVLDYNEWANYLPQIESVTAGIIVNFNNNSVIERRVAARNSDNPNDLTPELTLGQALEKAMGAKKDSNNILYIEDEYTDKQYTLDQDLVHFLFDRKTQKLIDKELINKKNIYDIIIRPGMNIQINIPSIYDKFSENKLEWKGGQYIFLDGERFYKFNNKISLSSLNLNSDSRYLISMDIKADTNCRLILDFNNYDEPTYIIDINNSYSPKYSFLVQFNEIDQLLNTMNITLQESTNVYIRNFSIIKLDKCIDYLKIENLNYKDTFKNKKIKISNYQNERKCIFNRNEFAVIENYTDNSNFKFSLEFQPNLGGFTIFNSNKVGEKIKKVLFWNNRSQELPFVYFLGDPRQLWLFKKEVVENSKTYYRIVNYFNRSKVLEFVPNQYNKKNLQINDLDVLNINQLFLLEIEN